MNFKKSKLRLLVFLLLSLLTIPFGSIAGAAETYSYNFQWGQFGSSSTYYPEDGNFNHAQGIVVHANGSVYVADTNNHRIQQFSATGAFIRKWGSEGFGQGQFRSPTGIAVDPSGYVYVADFSNHRIQKFTHDGNFVTEWGSYGTGNGQFNLPRSIAASTDGFIYVTDEQNHRVQKFTTDGVFVTTWGSNGGADGQFQSPYGIAVDAVGDVYVVEVSSDRVQKFTKNGAFLTKWGTYGTAAGEFNGPTNVEVNAADTIFVMDHANHRIQMFTGNGDFISTWGSYGFNNGEFNYPADISFDSNGNAFVLEYGNNRIQMFIRSLAPENRGIAVSAQVEEPPTLTFSVTAVSAPLDGTITDSAIDFGKLAANTPKTAVQRLSVSTNAVNGYTVTAEEDHPLALGTNQIPDVLGDSGTITEAATGSWDNSTTYGFGFTLTNITGSDAAFSLGFRQFADKSTAELAQTVMSNITSTAESKVDVSYKINIGSGQAAGTYTNTITFIATGNF